MMSNEIKSICRKCGKAAPASKFILDNVYGLMVCPECVKARRTAEIVKKQLGAKPKEEKAAEQKPTPRGWDKDDELLDRLYEKKKSAEPVVRAVRLTGNKVKYTCPKCKYAFAYDVETRKPSCCPYCAGDIQEHLLR